MTGAEALEHLSSRKDFLKMAGAAGLGAALASNILLREAFALEPTVPTDPSFKFSTTSSYHPFDVISKNFVEHSDGFDKDQGLYRVLTPAPDFTRGGVSFNKGRLRVSGDSPFFTLFQTGKSPLAPYAAVVVDITAFGRSATSQNSVYAGLIQDASNYVLAWYNKATNKVGIDVAKKATEADPGTVTTLVERDITLTAPVRFAFVLNSKEVTALADDGDGPFDGWKPVANYPNPPEVSGPGVDPAITPGLSQYVDLRDPEVLAQYKYGFGVRGDGGSIVLDKVQAGYWGRAGVRDPHVCTWADGTPYIKDNKLYLTLTNAGCDFFSTAHWGVYTLDLSDYTSPEALQEVGKIFFEREENSLDKKVKVFGDHAGHIVYDGAGKFLVGASTWGDFTYHGVQVNYTWTSENVLGGVHVLPVQKLDLPPVDGITYTYRGNWDPHFVRLDGGWYVGFVDSPSQGNPWKHYPALAKGSTLESLQLVGAESYLNQTEGGVLQKVGERWYLLCSSGRDEVGDAYSATYRIYLPESNDAGGLRFFGTLDAPYVSNIPHPMITPLPVDGNTKWLMVTFDGTDFYGWSGPEPLDYGTHGKFYVMDGPTWDGYHEFPPR